MRWPVHIGTLNLAGWHVKLAVMAAVLAGSQGLMAHPHGTVQCGFAVDYKNGQPHKLTGRLLFDEAHSTQALAVLRDPVTQKFDDALQLRFLFGLKRQLARWSWLMTAASDGELAELSELSDPVLWWSGEGRLGVKVEMSITGTDAIRPGALWTYSCQDPSRYWVSEFLQTEAAISVAGCQRAAISPAIKVATGPLAGTVNVNVTCPP